MPSLKEEIGRLSWELQLMAKGDEDVRLLMTIQGARLCTLLAVITKKAKA